MFLSFTQKPVAASNFAVRIPIIVVTSSTTEFALRILVTALYNDGLSRLHNCGLLISMSCDTSIVFPAPGVCLLCTVLTALPIGSRIVVSMVYSDADEVWFTILLFTLMIAF